MNIATVVKYLVLLHPLLNSLIEIAEAQVGPGKGATKLASVKAALEAVWGTLEGVQTDFQAAWPALQNAIAAIVALKSTLGFGKNAPSVASITKPA